MRSTAALLVSVHVLLHGVALAHAHAIVHDGANHTGTVHFHIPGRAHGHHDGREAVCGAHVAHGEAIAEHAGDDRPPTHDGDAIYLDDDVSILASEALPGNDAAAGWLAAVPGPAEVTPAAPSPESRRVRPPGGGGGVRTIRSLLPHVLRV